MLCCVLIALILGPLGLSAAALGTGGPDCCDPHGQRGGQGIWPMVWTLGAAATLLLACGVGAWLIFAPPSSTAFTHICTFLIPR